MTHLSDQEYINLVSNLKHAAEEISRDDPEMLRSFSDFCSVMWTDDAIVELLGKSYTDAMHDAYHALLNAYRREATPKDERHATDQSDCA
jgi:hypothetical protein